MMDPDLELALSLQFEEDTVRTDNSETQISVPQPGNVPAWQDRDGFKPTVRYDQIGASSSSLSIVDQTWELIDPVPNIHELFFQFNSAYFDSLLDGVEVKWSPRMTLCAGLCVYEGKGGLCSIRLSLPLLKLKPRRDLVQTLLHEMIHALLFVTQNNKLYDLLNEPQAVQIQHPQSSGTDNDHDAHGPEFHKHMNRINKQTGANITVYHNFHDEVNEYRQHWWKCDGPCQKRPPYFGIVRRAMNRAPSPHDTWWSDHQRTCGGKYTKIKEPENYGKKNGKRKRNETTGNDTLEKSVSGTHLPGEDSKLGSNDTHSLSKWFTSSSSGSKGQIESSNVAKRRIHDFSSLQDATLSVDSDKNVKPSNSNDTNVLFPGKGYVLGSRDNADRSSCVTQGSQTITKSQKEEDIKTFNRSSQPTPEGSVRWDRSFLNPPSKQSVPDKLSNSTSNHIKGQENEKSPGKMYASDKKDSSSSEPCRTVRKKDETISSSLSSKTGILSLVSTRVDTKGTKSSPIFVDQVSPRSSGSKCVECPVCPMMIPENEINDHLDKCLLKDLS